MKINTGAVLQNLKGGPLKNGDHDFTLGEAVANMLIADDAGGKMKLYVLATKFMSDGTIELDQADVALVKTAVERSKGYTSLVSGQVLLMIEEAQQ